MGMEFSPGKYLSSFVAFTQVDDSISRNDMVRGLGPAFIGSGQRNPLARYCGREAHRGLCVFGPWTTRRSIDTPSGHNERAFRMAIVEWNERYSVGIKELDEQHRRLFDIFNTLLEAEATPRGSNKAADALTRLRTYTVEHFELEEQYMAKCGYPDLESHIHIHASFRKKIDALCSAKPREHDDNLMEMLGCLYEWLVTHVGSCDQQYVPYVTGPSTATIGV
jgi:hemerythrin